VCAYVHAGVEKIGVSAQPGERGGMMASDGVKAIVKAPPKVRRRIRMHAPMPLRMRMCMCMCTCVHLHVRVQMTPAKDANEAMARLGKALQMEAKGLGHKVQALEQAIKDGELHKLDEKQLTAAKRQKLEAHKADKRAAEEKLKQAISGAGDRHKQTGEKHGALGDALVFARGVDARAPKDPSGLGLDKQLVQQAEAKKKELDAKQALKRRNSMNQLL